MSELDRKDFLKLTITVVGTACFAPACGEEDPPPTVTGGSGGMAPTGGAPTGGTATGGTATGGTATGGTATGGTATGGAGGAGSGGGGAGGAGAGGAGAGGGGAGGAGAGGMAGGGGRGGMSGGGGMAGGGGRGGMGGNAGGGGGMCMQGSLGFMQTSAETHDHLPIPGTGMNSLMSFAASVNAGTAFSFTLPMENMHSHTIMISAAECMMLQSGGMITGKMSSEDGMHTHTYTIECAA